jgi:hypothetical protein
MNEVDKILQEFYEGLHTRGETNWRLLKITHGAADIDNIIAHSPCDVAAGWIEWARASFSGSSEGLIFFGADEITPDEQWSIDTMRRWLDSHLELKGDN